MEWTIQQVARLAGTTSRTLRHYDETGLLPPTRVGANGYRYYDQAALVRLQRILLLRRWGLGLGQIAAFLDADTDDIHALQQHLARLHTERERLDRLIVGVTATVTRMQNGEDLMADEMFDGFDHTQYRGEVEQRWGESAYADSDAWWRGLDESGRQAFLTEAQDLAAAWRAASEAGLDPASDAVQELARRHHRWVTTGWGGRQVPGEALTGLAQMYVDDERFGRHYGGPQGASYVRDAATIYAERHM